MSIRILDSEQPPLCYVCGERPSDVMDHDHVTGRNRGRLCFRCNALAQDPEILRRALAYVKSSPIGEKNNSYLYRKYGRAWRSRNPGKVAEYAARNNCSEAAIRWREENRERMKEYKRNWYRVNKGKNLAG